MLLFSVNLFHIYFTFIWRIMTTYQLTENEDSDCPYGIEALSDGTSLRYDNVTSDRASMEAIVGICNEGGLEICHLEDILEDFLTDFCI